MKRLPTLGPALLLPLLLLAACAGTAEAPKPLELTYLETDPSPSQELRAVADASRAGYLHALISLPGWEDRTGRSAIVNGASATAVTSGGLAITAAHIAKGLDYAATVVTADGGRHRAATVDVSPDTEMALLRLPEEAGEVQPLPLAPPDTLQPSDRVFAIGAPDNRPGVVAQGHVVTPRRAGRLDYGDFGFADAIVVAMDAVPGFSGGPLLDMEGRLVGMVAAFDLEPQPSRHGPAGRTYAVPAAAIATYLAGTAQVEGNAADPQ